MPNDRPTKRLSPKEILRIRRMEIDLDWMLTMSSLFTESVLRFFGIEDDQRKKLSDEDFDRFYMENEFWHDWAEYCVDYENGKPIESVVRREIRRVTKLTVSESGKYLFTDHIGFFQAPGGTKTCGTIHQHDRIYPCGCGEVMWDGRERYGDGRLIRPLRKKS